MFFKFVYLGSILHEAWDSDVEIKRRIKRARPSSTKCQEILAAQERSLSHRLRFVKFLIMIGAPLRPRIMDIKNH